MRSKSKEENEICYEIVQDDRFGSDLHNTDHQPSLDLLTTWCSGPRQRPDIGQQRLPTFHAMGDPARADDLASQLAEERATVAALTTALTTSQANLEHALQRNVFVARELERDSAESMRRLEKLESTITDLKGERRDFLPKIAAVFGAVCLCVGLFVGHAVGHKAGQASQRQKK